MKLPNPERRKMGRSGNKVHPKPPAASPLALPGKRLVPASGQVQVNLEVCRLRLYACLEATAVIQMCRQCVISTLSILEPEKVGFLL